LPVVLALGLGALGSLLGPFLARVASVLHESYPSPALLLGRGPGVPVEQIPDKRRSWACAVGCGLLFALAGLHWGASARLVPYLLLFAVLVVMSVVDLEHSLIPNRLVFPALLVSIAATTAASLVDGTTSTLRFAAVGALAFFVGLLLAHVANPSGMGFGDVKLALLLGWFIGWSADGFGNAVFLVLVALLVASLLGSVVGVVLLARRGRGARYPFGPWLALGAVIVLLVTPALPR
jgi:leader peptidase (prepilin peptidase)/N-methyltransferase